LRLETRKGKVGTTGGGETDWFTCPKEGERKRDGGSNCGITTTKNPSERKKKNRLVFFACFSPPVQLNHSFFSYNK
jgi:hypothetical protein